VALGGQVSAEHDVPVQDGAAGVGDRVVHIIRFDQDGVEARNAPLTVGAEPLHEPWQHGKYGGCVGSGGGWFADGEADFSLGHGNRVTESIMS